MHPRAIGIEDASDLHIQPVLAVVIEEQRFGAALALVIAAADADRIDIPPIGFRLRMHGRIPIDLAGRSLENRRLQPLGQAQHVDRAVHGRLGRLHGVVLIVDRGGRAGEIEYLVHFHEQRQAHIVPHEFEPGVAGEVVDVALVAGEQVIDAQHFVPAIKQAVDEMRAQEARSTRHEHSAAPEVSFGQGFSPSGVVRATI